MRTCLFTLLFFVSPLLAQNADDIEGCWILHANTKGRFPVAEIYQEKGAFYMYAFAYTNASGGAAAYDSNNPDPALRGRPCKGLVILWNLTFSEASQEWSGGSIYRPEDGKTFFIKLKLSPDKNTIKARGSLDAEGLIGTGFKWVRTTNYSPLPRSAVNNPYLK